MKGALPSGWTSERLGDLLCKARAGFACGEQEDTGIIQFRMNNVTREGTIDWSKVRRIPRVNKKIDEFSVQPTTYFLIAQIALNSLENAQYLLDSLSL